MDSIFITRCPYSCFFPVIKKLFFTFYVITVYCNDNYDRNQPLMNFFIPGKMENKDAPYPKAKPNFASGRSEPLSASSGFRPSKAVEK
jgi:hypothetical protein